MAAVADIREVKTRRDFRAFIRLPWTIHKGHQGWVPPLLSEERAFFRPRSNPAFAYSGVLLLLARRGGVPVGRIMGIVNRRYNEAKGEKQARFSSLECGNDPELAQPGHGAGKPPIGDPRSHAALDDRGMCMHTLLIV